MRCFSTAGALSLGRGHAGSAVLALHNFRRHDDESEKLELEFEERIVFVRLIEYWWCFEAKLVVSFNYF